VTLNSLGFTLSIAAAAVCAALHVATFVVGVPGLLIPPPFFLLFGAIICARATQPFTGLSNWYRASVPTGNYAILGWILLGYSVVNFVYLYRSTGGASSVGIVDGQYVSMYKDHIIQTITEREYKMFPTLVVRVMSSWLAMMAVFCLSSIHAKGEMTRS
jgi:hypothetical protein